MPIFIRDGSGEWGLGNREWAITPIPHSPPPTLSRIHIHRSRQQRDGVVDVQRLADEERLAAFDSDQRAEITVARFYLAQERLRADARFRLRRLRIEELRGVRADRLPFALRTFADVNDEARRDC